MVTIDGSVVGFVSGGGARHKTIEYDCEVYAIYVLGQYQGQGLGTKLFHHMMTWLSEQGYKSLFVIVAKKNNYRVFYEKSGGTLTSFMETYRVGKTDLELIAYSWSI